MDTDERIDERKETNNSGSTIDVCKITPLTGGKLSLKQKWHWQGSSSATAWDYVHGPVVVGQLNDDNGDGSIDTRDIPDLVFTAGKSSRSTTSLLTAVSGANGSEIWV